MQKITPCLWFDDKAEEAAKFYTSIFPSSKIVEIVPYPVDTPSNKPIGSIMTVSFEIEGFKFLGLNGGPYFKMNPSISFIVGCETELEVNSLWNKLSHEESKVLLPLDKYSFSERYGWIQDKYGVSWQLILTKPEGDERPKIVLSMLFTGEVYGRAEETVRFYLSIFRNSKLGNLIHYYKGQEPNKEGTVMFSDFKIEDTWIAAMDGGGEHAFKFNEGISLMIDCENQEEMDYFYDKLSADPSAEVCGWIQDKYGVSWQLVTKELEELSKNKKVMAALLEMKRLDIATLKRAAEE